MAKSRKNAHSVWDVNYHIIWATKYRYKVLRGERATARAGGRVEQDQAGKEEGRSSPGAWIALWAIRALLAAGTLKAVMGPFRSRVNWMYFEQDDFFYYLKIAQNLAAGHGSTFNGLVQTNGYHPLWLLVLAAVWRLGVGPHGMMVFLAISVWAATMAVCLLSEALLRGAGVSRFGSAVWAAFIAVYCMHLFVECMEVTLAVPLMFGLLAMVQNFGWWSRTGAAGWMRGALAGLVASAMILSRLDTAIFLVLLGLGVAAQAELRGRVHGAVAGGVCAGLMPVGAYLAINRLVFGLWMPVSGAAKELKLDHGFTGKAWGVMSELTGTQRLNIAWVGATLLALPWLWRRMRPVERAIATATLTFPFGYFGLLSWLSDWRLWGWYFYGLRPALCVAILICLRAPRVSRWASTPAFMALLMIFTVLRISRLTWDEQVPTLADAAWNLKGFADMHHGIYAMGDRSGTVGFLLEDPIVQTEGLVMDRNFLGYISTQTPLREVLAKYGVRYYVASAMSPFRGCFQAVEPWQAGKHSPHMRAEFCEQPVARWMHEGVETMVFDLKPDDAISIR